MQQSLGFFNQNRQTDNLQKAKYKTKEKPRQHVLALCKNTPRLGRASRSLLFLGNVALSPYLPPVRRCLLQVVIPLIDYSFLDFFFSIIEFKSRGSHCEILN